MYEKVGKRIGELSQSTVEVVPVDNNQGNIMCIESGCKKTYTLSLSDNLVNTCQNLDRSHIKSNFRFDPRCYVTFTVNETSFPALIDSGSMKTYVNDRSGVLFGKFNKSLSFMRSANNRQVSVDGEADISFNFHNISKLVNVNLIKSLSYDMILGLDFLQTFGFLVDFENGICSLEGGRSWKVSFPDSSNFFSYAFSDSVASIDSSDPRYHLAICIKGKTVNALVDSGSARTYVGEVFKDLLVDYLIPCSTQVILADGSREKVLGEINTQVTLNGKRKHMVVRMVSSLIEDCILGMDFLKYFGIILDFGKNQWKSKYHDEFHSFDVSAEDNLLVGDCAGLTELSVDQKDVIDSLVTKWVKKPGDRLSTTNLTKHIIELTDDKPISQTWRRMSPKRLTILQSLVDKYEKEDIIERCKSPWSSPPVLVAKPNGDHRMCIDFRKVNKITKKHIHPIPNVDAHLDKFTNAQFLTKLDMTSAFLQIPIDEGSRDVTAFTVQGRGQFRFKRMPLGMSNSSSTYQEMITLFVPYRLAPLITFLHTLMIFAWYQRPLRPIFTGLKFCSKQSRKQIWN